MIFPLERYLKDLEYIVNIDSGSADIAGNAKVASFFEERFNELGLETAGGDCHDTSQRFKHSRKGL